MKLQSNWKVKAFVQNCIAGLPEAVSYETYFQMQRHFGGLKKPHNPMEDFSKPLSFLEFLKAFDEERLSDFAPHSPTTNKKNG